MRRCLDCGCFDEVEKTCRRFPPQAWSVAKKSDDESGNRWGFPVVLEWWWCKEFVSKE